jgi:glycosyltransferase involved in cell wall biosynthesis
LVGGRDEENPTAVPAASLAEWQRAGVVEWWGQRDDMPDVLAQAAIVCLPSYREGFPKILLEAAACGRPMVATDVPGCRDAIQIGVTGLLVPPHDVQALADALRTLLLDACMRDRLGRAARQVAVDCYGVGSVQAATLAIYRDLGALAGLAQAGNP